ncbi:MAG: hypothetical protein AAB480_03785 [Patescibacteria group bacterium]|mgnify:FL=1
MSDSTQVSEKLLEFVIERWIKKTMKKLERFAKGAGIEISTLKAFLKPHLQQMLDKHF